MASNNFMRVSARFPPTESASSASMHQFYYIYDTFPLPLSPESSASDIISDTGALVCNTCAIQQSVQLDPDEVPVRYYAPTNNVYVEEVKPTEDAPPTRLVEIGPLEVEDDDRDYDYDYKSLSAADDEEWAANDEQIHDYLNTSMGYGAQEQHAYLRIEAAKKRHMRRRARRTRSWQRDTLPAEKEILLARRDTLPDRIVSLADCMVTKRKKRVGQQGQYASDDTGEEPDTEGGAEEYTGIVETEEAIEVSACSLVAPM
ncbi:hypothetical protein N0V95_004485 [Ascochyta clinopodiicola]|nr:hypothetical protein N0V95_004485 [Ascochyta clinopodiicola]